VAAVRILWVKANKLLPVQSGGDIRSYNIAKQLARKHQLTFLSYYDGEADSEYERALQREFPDAICVSTGKHIGGFLQRGLDYAFQAVGDEPYAVSRFASAQVRSRLRTYYAERSFDVVVCDFLDAAVNFPAELSIPTVLFQHNVESEIWRRHAETESNPGKRMLYKVEFAKMLRYEEKIVRELHHVIAVSEHDRGLMQKWVEGSRIEVVPTGVDLEKFTLADPAFVTEPLAVFVGAMDWEPNIDAVEYFCEEIWPAVQAKVRNARFRIVGRNPERRVLRLASNSIEVTGSVPSVLEHLQKAAVVLVPLRIGGGTRLKIYEAMAVGKAVVSTSVGAEGLEVNNGNDIVLADGPESFADWTAKFMTDSSERHRFGRAAAATTARFNWPSIGENFSQILEARVENYEAVSVR
jgi:polysaccharide biosynthesis protein PslH